MFAFLGRLLLFFFAVSMIRSLVTAVVRAFRGTEGPPDRVAPKPPQDASVNPSASTLLHQDPVCGTYVAAGSSFRKVSKGQVLHFCSEECRDRYQA
jgi:YHS domain-containing protein